MEAIKSTIKSNLQDKLLTTLHRALALVVIAWMSNGFFSYVIPIIPNFVRYGIYAAWLFLAVGTNVNFLTKLIRQSLPLLFFLFYLFIISLFVDNPYIGTYISYFAYLGIIYSIFLYYSGEKSKEFQKKIVIFLLLEMIFVSINTYRALQIDPMIARTLAAGLDRAINLSSLSSFKGIGGYAFFYSLVPILLLLIYLLINHGKHKIILPPLILVFFITLVQAGYTFSILFFLSFIVILLLIRFFKKLPVKKYPFIPIFMIVIVTLVLSQNIVAPILIDGASLQWIPEVVSIRLYELAHFFMGNITSGTDLYGRLTLYSSSIESFFNNFIAGISVSPLSPYTAGGHSAWLDSLAYFGIFSFPMFFFFIKAYRLGKVLIPKKAHSFYKLYWIYFSVLGIVNTLFFARIFVIWFVMLPFALNILFSTEKELDQEA